MTELDYSFTNLLTDPDAWTSGHPPLSKAPVFRVRVDGGPADRPALATVCEDSAGFGYWEQGISGLEPRRRYTVEVLCRAQASGCDRLRQAALVTRDGKFYQQLDAVGLRDGWDVLRRTISGAEAAEGLALRLYSGWTVGEVRWSDARVYDTTDAEGPRTFRVAVVSGNPIKPQSPADCADFYGEKLDVAAAAKPDIVCLPEKINTTGLGRGSEQFAEPIPGPTTWRLAEKARDHGFYVAASILEQANDRAYNTGVLIDRHGGRIRNFLPG